MSTESMHTITRAHPADSQFSEAVECGYLFISSKLFLLLQPLFLSCCHAGGQEGVDEKLAEVANDAWDGQQALRAELRLWEKRDHRNRDWQRFLRRHEHYCLEIPQGKLQELCSTGIDGKVHNMDRYAGQNQQADLPKGGGSDVILHTMALSVQRNHSMRLVIEYCTSQLWGPDIVQGHASRELLLAEAPKGPVVGISLKLFHLDAEK